MQRLRQAALLGGGQVQVGLRCVAGSRTHASPCCAAAAADCRTPRIAGWPAFDKCYKGAVEITEDNSMGMQRIEITCAQCGGHLGHVFVGEKFTATNERHCVNSVSVKFHQGSSPASEEEVVTAQMQK